MKNVAQNKDRNKGGTRRVPALRFPEFARGKAGVSSGGASRVCDAGVAVSEWEEKRLGEIGDLKNGYAFKSEKYVSNGQYKVITIGNVKNGTLNSDKASRVQDAPEDLQNHQRLGISDMLVSMTGNVGRVCLVDEENCLLNQRVGKVVLKEKKMERSFIFHLLNTSRFESRMQSLAQGGAQGNISKGDILSFKIFTPSSFEQKKIARFFGAVDEWIEILREERDALAAYKRGMMQKLFSRTIRFKDDADNDFPEWEEKKLGEVLKIKKGEQFGKLSMTEGGKYPVINGGVTASGYSDKWNTPKDTITISEGGNSCGHVSIIKSRFWCGGHCYALVDISKKMNQEYLFHWLKYGQEDIMRLRVGSGLPNIQKKDLERFSVGLPSIFEQKKIADFLTALDDLLATKSDEITRAEEWKKGLMQKMFV